MTSKPIAATASSRLAAVVKVPLVTLPVFGVVRGALGAREELVPAAVERRGAVGVRRVGALDGDQLAQRVARRGPSASSAASSAASRASARARRCRSAASIAPSSDRRRVGGRVRRSSAARTRSSSSRPSVNISSTSTPARDLDARRRAARWRSGRTTPGPRRSRRRGVRGHPGLVEVRDLGVLGHPHRGAAYAVGAGQHHLGAELVVALAEHGRRDGEGLADRRLGGLATEVDQRA